MTTIGPDDLARIEARADAATDGPWVVDPEYVEDDRGADTFWHVSSESGDPLVDDYMSEADAEFIAHARTDVPALVAALRDAWAERDEARAALARVEALCDFVDTPHRRNPGAMKGLVTSEVVRAAIAGPA